MQDLKGKWGRLCNVIWDKQRELWRPNITGLTQRLVKPSAWLVSTYTPRNRINNNKKNSQCDQGEHATQVHSRQILHHLNCLICFPALNKAVFLFSCVTICFSTVPVSTWWGRCPSPLPFSLHYLSFCAHLTCISFIMPTDNVLTVLCHFSLFKI